MFEILFSSQKQFSLMTEIYQVLITRKWQLKSFGLDEKLICCKQVLFLKRKLSTKIRVFDLHAGKQIFIIDYWKTYFNILIVEKLLWFLFIVGKIIIIIDCIFEEINCSFNNHMLLRSPAIEDIKLDIEDNVLFQDLDSIVGSYILGCPTWKHQDRCCLKLQSRNSTITSSSRNPKIAS